MPGSLSSFVGTKNKFNIQIATITQTGVNTLLYCYDPLRYLMNEYLAMMYVEQLERST
jgi:hypothetical protein